MTKLKTWVQTLYDRKTIKQDAVAGLALGVVSVPDGLAGGLLAGVNPVFGLYGYMMGTLTGALFTSATFMAVQATGAMAIVVSDVPQVRVGEGADRALFTLAVMTGVVMLIAGFFKLGTLLRWVSNSVMVGFINAVGVNIILGQLDNFSGYEAVGVNRVTRAFDLLFNLGQAHWPSMLIGAATILLIIALEKTRLGPLGMVVAIVLTSGVVVVLGAEVAQLRDITDVPGTLPLPVLPDLSLIPVLIVPAVALAFVGLVQGAGISGSMPNPDGEFPDASQDFVGQGAANVAAGLFQGMPVGGSMSASSLVKTAGARSKLALIIASGVMAIAILLFSNAVGYIAMPSLAALLMLVGYRTIKPEDIKAVWRTGATQATVMTVTFVLTMLIPLQNAVMVGIGISLILFVIKQSNRMTLKRWEMDDTRGRMKEVDPPSEVGVDEVIVLQPYGSLFFASAPVFDEALPDVTPASHNSVVIIRLRGKSDLGTTFMDVLARYAYALRSASCKLVVTYADEKVSDQLVVTGAAVALGKENIYESDEWLGATVRRANDDARTWIAENRQVD
ncbi:MAG: SulP family inorganic anion transporter [Acidobacteria bacterium]|nr:MAG: SulP family inorganic anion transporter [Acidobacteriota bacterium]